MDRKSVLTERETGSKRYRIEERKEAAMKLNVKALAFTSAIVWALVIFLTGAANLVWEGYGSPLLQLLASLYPGYHAQRSLGRDRKSVV